MILHMIIRLQITTAGLRTSITKPPNTKTKAAIQIFVTVFQQHKNQSLLNLTGASEVQQCQGQASPGVSRLTLPKGLSHSLSLLQVQPVFRSAGRPGQAPRH